MLVKGTKYVKGDICIDINNLKRNIYIPDMSRKPYFLKCQGKHTSIPDMSMETYTPDMSMETYTPDMSMETYTPDMSMKT